jgi:SAM-dependent methyltransferase
MWLGPAAAGAGRRSQAQAWTLFWREQGADSRCLADARPDVRHLLNHHWAAFAATLASDSRILDVGCGAGAVGRALLAARPGLRITGVDLAQVPAPGDRRLALLPGTPIEDLPFGDGSFDAAVSQFGLEYGDVRAAAAPLARVLLPGAPVSFVVHHRASSVAQRSLARSRALAGLLGDPVRRAFLAADAVAPRPASRSWPRSRGRCAAASIAAPRSGRRSGTRSPRRWRRRARYWKRSRPRASRPATSTTGLPAWRAASRSAPLAPCAGRAAR